MNILEVRELFMWSTVFNLAILITWFVLWSVFQKQMYHMQSRYITLTPEQYSLLVFCGMGLYKLGILFFNLVPYVALSIVK